MSKHNMLVGDDQMLNILKIQNDFDDYFKVYRYGGDTLYSHEYPASEANKIDVILVNPDILDNDDWTDFISKNKIIHSKTKFVCQSMPENSLSLEQLNSSIKKHELFGVDASNFYFISSWPFHLPNHPTANILSDIRLSLQIGASKDNSSGYADSRESYYNRKFSDKIKEKYYISRNARAAQHRAWLVMKLIEDGILDKGYVSFLARGCTHDQNTPKEVIHLIWPGSGLIEYTDFDGVNEMKKDPRVWEMFNENIDNDFHKKFNRLHNKLYSMTPFSVEDGLANDYKKIEHSTFQGVITHELDAYFDVCTESTFGPFPQCSEYVNDGLTLFERNKWYDGNISEKASKAYFGYNIPLFLCSPYTSDAFSKAGFEDFPDIVDLSYDSEMSHVKRFNMVYDELKKICNMEKNDLHDLYMSQKDKLIHNYNLGVDILKDDKLFRNLFEFVLS